MDTIRQEALISKLERNVASLAVQLRAMMRQSNLFSASKIYFNFKHAAACFRGGNYAAPIIVLISGVAVSIMLFSMVSKQIEDEARLRFERQASDAHHVIQARISSYVEVIRGLAALFQTSGTVSRQEFHRYVNGLQLEHSYPGFQSLNYALLVQEDERPEFEANVKRDTSLDAQGYPFFSITPSGKRASYSVLVYQEPMASNMNTFGKDLAASASSAQALAKSRDTGELISSGCLIRVDGPNKHTGLAMRLPVYRHNMPLDTVDQRRAAYKGSVGAGFNVKKLMSGTLNNEGLQTMRLRMYDRGPADEHTDNFTHGSNNLLFDSQDGEQASANLISPGKPQQTTLSMEIGGRIWETEFTSKEDAAVNHLDSLLPWATLSGGILASCLLSWIFYAMAFSRGRAIKLAKGMTRKLRENQANLAEAQHTAHLGSWSLDRADGKMSWSAETYRLLECDAETVSPGFEAFCQRIHGDDRTQLSVALEQVVSLGYRVSGEYRISRRDNTIRWAQIILQPAKPGEDRILNGTIMDITERKQAALLAEVEHRVTQLAASANESAQVMPQVLEALCKGLGCSAACFHVMAENGPWLRYAASWRLDSVDASGFLERKKEELILFGSGAAGRAWERRWPQLMCSHDAELQSELRHTNLTGMPSAFAFPILSEDSVFGVIECFARPDYQAYEGLQKMLMSISGQISLYFQRKVAETNLRHVANHDSLTNLPNRNLFNQTLQQALTRNARYQEGLAVLFIDVDRFKIVNDTLGHRAGDLLLIEFSARLKECLRDSDIVARLGGDEFAVMIENFDHLDDVITVVNKILANSARPFLINGKEFKTTASVGIAVAPDDGDNVDSLLKNADVAMYRAKVDGNNHQFYSPQMNVDSLKRFTMESSLRHAVENNEMFLHYQPKLDLHSGLINGVEALLRWKHPQWGMVSPSDFIPLAEESGLITEIGKWVLREACRQTVAWQKNGLHPLRVAVNLSARQFRDEKLLQDITGILEATGLAPEFLEIEVTESMVMHDAQQAIQVLQRLKQLGVRLSIDDFGTGYSSLAYLRHLPVDCVKIDRSFIKDIPHQADDMAVTAGIVGLAHCLRLQVVAEGIETSDQMAFLKTNGCDEIQGYFFSKPLPAAEVSTLLEHSFHKSLAKDVTNPGQAPELVHD